MITRKLFYVSLLILLFLFGCGEKKNDSDVSSGSNIIDKTDVEQQERERFMAFNEKTGLVQQNESDHFTFFSKVEDKQCIKDLSKALEDNYERVTNELQVKLNDKVEIYIYPDLNTYHIAINQPDAREDNIASAIPGHNIILLVNPSKEISQPYTDFMKTIVHEFTHVVIFNINPEKSVPLWIHEGLAQHEAGQDQGIKEFISDVKKTGQFPDLKDLENYTSFAEMKGYQFSNSIIEYMIRTYGFDKIIALIKSPSEFEKIMGASKDAFKKEWISSLN